MSDLVSCPVCWGKGEWPAISDREWSAHGGRRGCDYIQRCGYCRGTGEVKETRSPIGASPAPSPTGYVRNPKSP